MSTNLNNLKCTPCSAKTPKLSHDEISINFKKLSKWSINDEKEMLFKKFIFKTFKSALNFTNSVGVLAEKEGHHPDISLGWGYCLIMIHTHAIKGLSINDFVLASKIDLIDL